MRNKILLIFIVILSLFVYTCTCKCQVNDIFVIPQEDGGHVCRLDNGNLINICKIKIPYDSKTVISESGLIISLGFEKKEKDKLIFHDTTGKIINEIEVEYINTIAVKSNTLYLGGESDEKISLINLLDEDFKILKIDFPIPNKSEKGIDDILILENKMILVDNVRLPKYLIEYDISTPNSPIHIKTTELKSNGTWEHIKKGDINKDWIVLFSTTMCTMCPFSTGFYVEIDGKTKGRIGTDNSIKKVSKEETEKMLEKEKDKFEIKDISLINNYLFVLTPKELLKFDLYKEFIFENGINVPLKINEPDKLMRTNDILIVYNKNDYEIIQMSE